jgi:ABC-2 type transport system permease protein
MNTHSNGEPESLRNASTSAPAAAPAPRPPARTLYWSIRRELWECRYLYLVPLGCAAVYQVGFLIYLTGLPGVMRGLPSLGVLHRHTDFDMPYDVAAGLIMAAAAICALYYCLDALYGERRDRSILFWKSLPVSDFTTVASKACIVAGMQVFGWAVTAATHFIMLLLSSAVVAASGHSVATLWAQVGFFQMSTGLLYHLITVHTLWYAPIYAWLLLVSAWARRTPFLWATFPALALCFAEKIVFNSWHLGHWFVYRFSGPQVFGFPTESGAPMDPMTKVAPFQFFSTPGLWFGLIGAAGLLALAVRLRRYREPI